MAKHLIDSDLYIDLIQSGTTLPVIRELYEEMLPEFISVPSSLRNYWREPVLLPEKDA